MKNNDLNVVEIDKSKANITASVKVIENKSDNVKKTALFNNKSNTMSIKRNLDQQAIKNITILKYKPKDQFKLTPIGDKKPCVEEHTSSHNSEEEDNHNEYLKTRNKYKFVKQNRRNNVLGNEAVINKKILENLKGRNAKGTTNLKHSVSDRTLSTVHSSRYRKGNYDYSDSEEELSEEEKNDSDSQIHFDLNLEKVDLERLQKGIKEILNDSDQMRQKESIQNYNSVKNVIININQSPFLGRRFKLRGGRIMRSYKLERENVRFYKKLNSITPLQKKFKFEEMIEDLKSNDKNNNTINLETVDDSIVEEEKSCISNESSILPEVNDYIFEMVHQKVSSILGEIVENYLGDFVIVKPKRENYSLDSTDLKRNFSLCSNEIINVQRSVTPTRANYFSRKNDQALNQCENLIKTQKHISKLNKVQNNPNPKSPIIPKSSSLHRYVFEEKHLLIQKTNQHIRGLLKTKKKQMDYVAYKRKLLKVYSMGFQDLIITEVIPMNNLFKQNISSYDNKGVINYLKFANEHLFDIFLDYQKQIIKSIYIEAFNDDLEVKDASTLLSNFSLDSIYNENIPIRELMWRKYRKEMDEKKIVIETLENRKYFNEFALADHLGMFGEDKEMLKVPSVFKKNRKMSLITEISEIEGQSEEEAKGKSGSSDVDTAEENDKVLKIYQGKFASISNNKVKKSLKSITKVSKQISPNVLKFADKYSILKGQDFFIKQKLEYHSPELIRIAKRKLTVTLNHKIRNPKIDWADKQSITDKWSYALRTNEIKTKKLRSLTHPFDILKFYIEEKNVIKFRDLFFRTKIDPEKIDENGNTLLNLAVQADNIELTKYLIQMGSDVNTQNYDLNTPLHYALSRRNFVLSNLLIANKADEVIVNKRNMTPWQCLGMGIN